MTDRRCKELWRLRFRRVKKSEEEAILRYQLLIKKCDHLPKSKEIRETFKTNLKMILKDERKHARLAEKLLNFAE